MSRRLPSGLRKPVRTVDDTKPSSKYLYAVVRPIASVTEASLPAGSYARDSNVTSRAGAPSPSKPFTTVVACWLVGV